MEFQSLVARCAWSKILKFTDSRFLNLARVQVNFKIYLARARRRTAVPPRGCIDQDQMRLRTSER